MNRFKRTVRMHFGRTVYLVAVLIAVTLLSATATGFGLLYSLLFLLLLTSIVAYLWNWFNLLALTIKIDRNTSIARVGDTLLESVTIKNESMFPKFLLEVDVLGDLYGRMRSRSMNLSGKGVDYRVYRTPLRKRGIYELGPVLAVSICPFGLFRREIALNDKQRLIIYPRMYELAEIGIAGDTLPGENPGRRRSVQTSPSVSSIRQYVTGDSLSHIHWSSTAKHGMLMSKEFEATSKMDVWLVVDMERAVQAGHDEFSTDEYAASIAASIAKSYLERGITVGLLAYGDRRYYLPCEYHTKQLENISHNLAVCKPEGAVPLNEVLTREKSLWSDHSIVIAITPSTSNEWPRELKRLCYTGTRVAALVVDPGQPGRQNNTNQTIAFLAALNIKTSVVKSGDSIPMIVGRHSGGRQINHHKPEAKAIPG